MIRYAKIEDAKFIQELSTLNLETSLSMDTLKEYILTKETYHVFVSESDSLTGYLILWISDTYAEVIDIVVKEKYRRKGYAKEMLKFAYQLLKENNVKSLSLEVSVDNIKAINLYENEGFIIVKAIKNYYKSSDAFIYSLGIFKWCWSYCHRLYF